MQSLKLVIVQSPRDVQAAGAKFLCNAGKPLVASPQSCGSGQSHAGEQVRIHRTCAAPSQSVPIKEGERLMMRRDRCRRQFAQRIK